ncbi:beta propeller repeat protein [Lignipirellula cremea]|uniref:BNR/Asp-box repeat protein n=1 Tax=Lignipirellula cremea TaxID=2528010 RepID=A0A518DRA0_9BACT|nr:hypothetical protein [Lignipirellula cremea]QDU94352.1 hypothetical protein Pla8534_21410 [Lignipirellula cremea]
MSIVRCIFSAILLALAIGGVFANRTVSAADGFFLAIGGVDGRDAQGNKLEGQFGTLYTSEDGETWKEVFRGGPVKEDFTHANNNMWRCATYGNGRFVVTGNPKGVLVSENGQDWRVINAPAGSMSVEYGNGLFLAPNAVGFLASKDGLEWESLKPPVDFQIWGAEGAGHVRQCVFGNGVFVCVGEQRLGVTRDGKTWLHHRLLTPEQRPGRSVLLFGNGRFVWLCEKTPSMTSTDGVNWTPIDLKLHEGEGAFGQHGAFDGKHFWTAAPHWKEPLKNVYRSEDGQTWTQATQSKDLPAITTAGNGLLLANVGFSQSFRFSRDGGDSWKEVKVDVPSRKVYFFNGERIVGQSGG